MSWDPKESSGGSQAVETGGVFFHFWGGVLEGVKVFFSDSPNHVNGPETSGINKFLFCFPEVLRAALLDANLNDASGLAHGADHRRTLLRSRRHRLFHVDILESSAGVGCDHGVIVIPGGNNYRIDIFAIEETPIVGVQFDVLICYCSGLFSPLIPCVGYGDPFDATDSICLINEVRTPSPRADDAHPNAIVGAHNAHRRRCRK